MKYFEGWLKHFVVGLKNCESFGLKDYVGGRVVSEDGGAAGAWRRWKWAGGVT